MLLALAMIWSLGATVWAEELAEKDALSAQGEMTDSAPEAEEKAPEAEETPDASEGAEPVKETEGSEPAEAVEEDEAPSTAKAEKTTSDEEGEASGLWINPLYEDEVDARELEAELQELEEEDTLEAQGSGKTYTKIKDAGKALRAGMKKRSKVTKLTFRTKKYGYSTLANKLYDEAMKHTGKPTEGDYLAANMVEAVGR